MLTDRLAFDHPAWIAVGGTALGYALLLLGFFVALFGLAWLAFVWF